MRRIWKSGRLCSVLFWTVIAYAIQYQNRLQGYNKNTPKRYRIFMLPFTDIDANCSQWVFTDGHAKSNLTEFFNSSDDFDKVDWTMVKERMWKNNEEDFDRMRRKQAEFLVKDQVSVNCIGGIIVYNEEKKVQVQHIIDKLKLTIPVKVNTNYYY
ncbi:MAG TPA: DUF4433 domain-containing protein [Bacteroidales bacterium]|nr:DUF4433 domain-containing protein [Bacteroidales bacterium]